MQSNNLSIVAFVHPSYSSKSSQLCYVIRLLINEVQKGNPFHVLTSSSHRSRRPAKSTPAVDIIAASEAVEKTVVLKDVMSTVVGSSVKSMFFFV